MKQFPNFIYGTAWKEDKTTDLVDLAISSGFRAIDTANQAKHYSEILVGEALINSDVDRDQIWLQSKFTPLDSQDHRVPYDQNAEIFDQVVQSFSSTLENLHTDYLDAYLLHGPYNYPILGDEDFEAWSAMEEIFDEGLAGLIGISNINVEQLELLCENSVVMPMTVQNRCFADKGWDKQVRDFCTSNNIHYQGFSLLTANMEVVGSDQILEMAKKYQVGPAQIIFKFAQQIGITPLTGTTNQGNMVQDLNINQFSLSEEELEFIESFYQ